MSATVVVQIAGALLIVAAFALSQANRLDPRSYAYLLLNVTGSAILAVLAVQEQRWGFVLLESVWTLVSLGALLMKLQGKDSTPVH